SENHKSVRRPVTVEITKSYFAFIDPSTVFSVVLATLEAKAQACGQPKLFITCGNDVSQIEQRRQSARFPLNALRVAWRKDFAVECTQSLGMGASRAVAPCGQTEDNE